MTSSAVAVKVEPPGGGTAAAGECRDGTTTRRSVTQARHPHARRRTTTPWRDPKLRWGTLTASTGDRITRHGQGWGVSESGFRSIARMARRKIVPRVIGTEPPQPHEAIASGEARVNERRITAWWAPCMCVRR